jgi:ribosome-binding protein aMBF1 (putative translation factor)
MSSPFSHQDWEPVVLKKKPVQGVGAGGGGAGGGGRRGPIIPEDGTEMKRKVITVALKTAIMKARVAKQWKQQDLASKLGVPVKTVNEYESGKAIPSNAFIRKMELALGVKLPRAINQKDKI